MTQKMKKTHRSVCSIGALSGHVDVVGGRRDPEWVPGLCLVFIFISVCIVYQACIRRWKCGDEVESGIQFINLTWNDRRTPNMGNLAAFPLALSREHLINRTRPRRNCDIPLCEIP